MENYDNADYFGDVSLVADPHAYFAHLRLKGPVTPLPARSAVAVTGYEEAIAVVLDDEHFSSINSMAGAMQTLPFAPESDDISENIEPLRGTPAFPHNVATADGVQHAVMRSLLARLFTPGRLKAVDEGLVATADELIDAFIANGRCDIVNQFGRPFTTTVVADLLGIPKEVQGKLCELLKDSVVGPIGEVRLKDENDPFLEVAGIVFGFVSDRRAHPRDDILTVLATSRYPDGSEPSLMELAGIGALLFGAGQDTTNHLIGNAMRLLATRPDLQDRLRVDPSLTPSFVEEMLRFDGSVKTVGRLCIKTTTIAGVEIKAGTPLMVSHMGANRDPRRFEHPNEFILDRPRAREHLGFGRGPHTCIGATLARAEARTAIDRILSRMTNICLDREHHVATESPHFEYQKSYVLRALEGLHVTFDPT